MKNPKNAGRKLKYGEPTVLMRIPESMVNDIQAVLDKRVVLEDIVAYPKNVQHIIESMAEMMGKMAAEVQQMFRETILIAWQNADEENKPKVLNALAQYEASLPDHEESQAEARGIVKGFFDDVVDGVKPKFLD